MNNRNKYYCVVPAAGVGSRMGTAVPKQYLRLHGKTVIEHTLARLCAHPLIEGVVVAIGADDQYWPQQQLPDPDKIYVAQGGAERCHSVLNGLQFLSGFADVDDWVLVHDAARPCLHHDDISRMIDMLSDHPVGGLLGVPVADTVKRSNPAGEVLQTVSRDHLWRALTPQMFRLSQLQQALQAALDEHFLVTDEASAMEHAGLKPHMVEGRADNIKITRPEDLSLAELYLAQQETA
ncbi:2-C-methyl-D-erythritol 4-phosphate cytidylyltransferase [Candidatus Tenderia electrophaga]|jgi:2-C-methyl-D-erythritol 4-phosphate cytidylyltransferase|uniref:2-C-methyl-D-erythritol 4-phosphate cytidylyltransferase n=1 Tax=Candidatus Tenderia electrophaga TaxID=1748243 RepID=A0A0S2TDA9_9GAMM|nr:2-C-methyl-D-erythritol 4-phosphate cytidylyltransferase [Candidatus Tenderia electrophaga]